jgi:hypothetical protein
MDGVLTKPHLCPLKYGYSNFMKTDTARFVIVFYVFILEYVQLILVLFVLKELLYLVVITETCRTQRDCTTWLLEKKPATLVLNKFRVYESVDSRSKLRIFTLNNMKLCFYNWDAVCWLWIRKYAFVYDGKSSWKYSQRFWLSSFLLLFVRIDIFAALGGEVNIATARNMRDVSLRFSGNKKTQQLDKLSVQI